MTEEIVVEVPEPSGLTEMPDKPNTEVSKASAEVKQDQKPSESATEAQGSETPDTENPPEKQQAKGKHSFERKIDRLYKTAAEQKARADLLEKQLEELKPKPVRTGGPKIEDFEYDYEKYAEAVAKQAESKAIEKYEAERRAQEERKFLTRLESDWDAKIEKAADKYQDFDDVVGELKPTNPVIRAIMEAENGEDVAYYLATNEDEARKIAALDNVSAIRAIGKLEAKLLAAPKKPETPSKAPEPISPLRGKGSVLSEEPSEEDDMATWLRKRSKQVRG